MNESELIANMGNPYWRLRNLYWIINKSGQRVLFSPNEAQEKFLEDLWHRNIIPKARQRGISTVVQLVILDACIFNENQSGAVIAQSRKVAGKIFRKMKFSYDNLPEMIREQVSLKKETAEELIFSNGSALEVATSARGDTLQWLHVSEFGKICAKNPLQAREIVTGSLPSVDMSGMVFIESTAEGKEGAFYEMTQDALNLQRSGANLSALEYRIHFYSWWDADEYEMDPEGVLILDKDHQYFAQVEKVIGRALSLRKRAWYVTKRRSDFAGDPQLMFQEYPSTVEECFSVSLEGAYYAIQMAQARTEGRICKLPLITSVPCNTFWDIGASDGTAIWVHQQIGAENRFVRFYEEWHKPYEDAAKWLQGLGLMWGVHHLPHDADHVRQGKLTNESPKQMLEALLPGHTFVVVPRTPDINWGIQSTRNEFPTYFFDEEHCAPGIEHLDAYRKQWNERQECWSSLPSKAGGHSEAADALRQHAQGYQRLSSWNNQPIPRADTASHAGVRYSRASQVAASTTKDWTV